MVKKVVNRLFLVVYIFIFLMGLSVLYQRYVEEQQYPRVFGFGFGFVTTGSMAPAINGQTAVITLASDVYHVGDIVAYKSDKIPTIHRVKSIKKSEIITQGDANNVADRPIQKKDIYGRVILVFPSRARIIRFLINPVTLGLICLGSVLFIKRKQLFSCLKQRMGGNQ
ncbi:MAG: signal peptidase I [Streptococcaceae bacterium]|jgi:signal peptidase I|nr:signal peptidase I [Streptococcaceae bacterium]